MTYGRHMSSHAVPTPSHCAVAPGEPCPGWPFGLFPAPVIPRFKSRGVATMSIVVGPATSPAEGPWAASTAAMQHRLKALRAPRPASWVARRSGMRWQAEIIVRNPVLREVFDRIGQRDRSAPKHTAFIRRELPKFCKGVVRPKMRP